MQHFIHYTSIPAPKELIIYGPYWIEIYGQFRPDPANLSACLGGMSRTRNLCKDRENLHTKFKVELKPKLFFLTLR